MNLKHFTGRKLISLLLSVLILLAAGCSSDAAPAAAVPAEIQPSEELPVVPGSEPETKNTSAESKPAATQKLPQTERDVPSSQGVSAGTDDTPPVQDSAAVSPSPAGNITTITPTLAASLQLPSPAPTTTVMPANPPEAVKDKPAELVYPINSFSNDSVLCLTFDDGGNKKAVKKALEVLEQYDIKCTFFVIGKYLESHADLWKQAIDQGHQICNHTQNHKWLSELSSDEVKKEILAWEASAAEVLGEEYVQKMKEEFPYLRLPGGAASKSKRVLGILSELGYTPVGWNVESYYAVLRKHDLKNDPLSDIAGEVAAHITKKASGGSIILLHFNPYDTTSLEVILQGISDKNLAMQLLSEQGF